MAESTPPTLESPSALQEYGFPYFANGNKAGLVEIDKNVSNIERQYSGQTNSANDITLYIFKGTANKVQNIYESFNKSGIIKTDAETDTGLTACSSWLYDVDVKIVPDKLLFNSKLSYTTENLDKLTKSGLFGAIRNGAEGLMNISNVMGGIGSIFDKKDSSETSEDSRSIGDKFNAGMTNAKDAAHTATDFNMYINRYKNIPYYTDYNFESLTSFTCKFGFGQSRLFSSLEEVVKPIVNLVNIFNIKAVSGSATDARKKNFFNATGIMPTKTEALTKMYGSLFDSGHSYTSTATTGADATTKYVMVSSSGSRSVFNTQAEAESAMAAASSAAGSSGVTFTIETETTSATAAGAGNTKELFENLSLGFADAISKAAEENTVTGILFRVGNYIAGPFIPTSLEWNFDFSRVDEFGFPCYGDLTFNGLKMIDMDPTFVKKAWGLY